MGNINLESVKLMRELKCIVSKKCPEHSEKIISRAIEINRQLNKDNLNQTSAQLRHTRQKIYPAIAFYKAMIEITENQSIAYDLIAQNFNEWGRKTNKILRLLCKIPFSYKLVPVIMAKIIHSIYGNQSGFHMNDYATSKSICHIDMTVCPYHSYCVKYECSELGTAFCNSDDIAYDNMHSKLYWGRKKTLARGDDCCDFILDVIKDRQINP